MAQCPLLALSGHSNRASECPLSGVKRTFSEAKRTCRNVRYDPKPRPFYVAVAIYGRAYPMRDAVLMNLIPPANHN